jgi:hypothetical protein
MLRLADRAHAGWLPDFSGHSQLAQHTPEGNSDRIIRDGAVGLKPQHAADLVAQLFE